MKQTLRLLITFDHELFLGKNSGNLEYCLLEPGQIILDILKKFKIQGLFFFDTCFYREAENNNHYSQRFKNLQQHLIKILQEDHLIYPHIHPHWENATFDLDTLTWDLSNYKFYRFQSLNSEQQNSIFKDSINVISEIQKFANVFYPIDSFRAGGWCIQPFTDFKKQFIKHKITYDLSVIPNYQFEGEIHSYNFSNIANDKAYKFSEDPNLPDVNGNFIEIPITIYKWNFKFFKKLSKINAVLRDKIKLNHFEYFGNGKIASQNGIKKTPLDLDHFSFENLTWNTLLKYLFVTIQLKQVHFISHTKVLTRHNILCLRIYLYILSKFYTIKSNYTTFRNS
jgi:hypothetical protein